MNDHEELLARVNQGNMATASLNWMSGIFETCEKELVSSLKLCFRTGKYDESVLVSHAAQLTALDTLKEKLVAMARTGETSFQQMEEMKKESTDGRARNIASELRDYSAE